MEPAEPFTIVGLDFAGPFYVSDVSGAVTKGRKDEQVSKSYILLLTCAVTRCVHLELVPDMSAHHFARAFRRFEVRRGPVREVFSDNAKTFVKYRSQRPDLRWKLIPERAPWWGGFYERLVRSIKSALKPVIGKHLLSFKDLEDLVLEVEGVLNGRPLCPVSDDRADGPPLTPNSFLKPRVGPPPALNASTVSNQRTLLRLYRARRRFLSAFWTRWLGIYRRSLHEWRTAAIPQRPSEPRVGDTVLIHEDQPNRFKWPIARVTELIRGRDGVVRAALVRVAGGSVLRRATRKLYLMEAADPDDQGSPNQDGSTGRRILQPRLMGNYRK